MILLYIGFLLLIIKAVRLVSIAREKPPETVQDAEMETINMSVLLALQAARESQEDIIQYISESITTAQTAQETISLMQKRTAAIEKLARIEKQITKLIN